MTNVNLAGNTSDGGRVARGSHQNPPNCDSKLIRGDPCYKSRSEG